MEQPVSKSFKVNKFLIILPVSALALGIIIVGGLKVYALSYSDKVFPGVQVGQYQIGGLGRNELINLIEGLNNRYAKEGIDLTVDGKTPVKLSTVASGDSAVEMIRLDSDALGSLAMQVGRSGNWFTRLSAPLMLRFRPLELSAPVAVNAPVLKNVLKDTLSPYEETFRNASVKNVNEALGSAEVLPEKSGLSIDYDNLIVKLKQHIANLQFEPVEVKLAKFHPTIISADVEKILPTLGSVLRQNPLVLVVSSSTSSTTLEWSLGPAELAQDLEVSRNDQNVPVFSLKKDKVETYLTTSVLPALEIPALDAKFTVENGKVKEFQADREGRTVNIEETYSALNDLFKQRNAGEAATNTVAVVLETVAPKVKTQNLNDLGIVEIVGAGTSTFKDSHSNRIKNIANAVKRLNGTLIKPGEEFSANKYAGPFTQENGFLPEQIIKGRQIKDEVGGGMCQIGTTLFRMAMQTGLPITERHNHSLVVQYYADPVNGNPGTDATLYEPTLDLKFLNETKNYLLLQTDIDFQKQMLTFTLWGTKDGRSGSYTHPLVSKWIPAPKEVEYVTTTAQTEVPLDGQKCQNAFRGAVASFTYTRITPTGEKIEHQYDSYYRPLPKICTVTPSSTPMVTSTTSTTR